MDNLAELGRNALIFQSHAGLSGLVSAETVTAQVLFRESRGNTVPIGSI